MNRCHGDCCVAFLLEQSPEELVAQAQLGGEAEQIHGMVRYLGQFSASPHEGGEPADGVGHYYSCNNLLPNGDCAIYKQRPSMCREYPAGGACLYRSCTALRVVA